MSNKNSNPSQCQRLMIYLGTHPNGITQIEALSELGILRLASRVSELKENHIPIVSKYVTVINRFQEKVRVKKYWLLTEKEKAND